jgi:hypothetical protein
MQQIKEKMKIENILNKEKMKIKNILN